MIKRFLFSAALLFVLSCAVKREDADVVQWQYFYDLGMSSYMARNYSEAIANFFRASQIAPNQPKVWNALGMVYMEVQEYAKSEESFLRALQVDKNYTESRLNLGVLYNRQGRHESAINLLREVLRDEAFPQKHMAFYHLAKAYQSLGDNQEYINNLRRATAYNPMFTEAQLELAQAFESVGDLRSARATYQALINNGMSSPAVELSMARIENLLGNYSAAKEHIRRVLEDKRSTSQQRSEAYQVLSSVLIKEQSMQANPRLESVSPPASSPTSETRQEKPEPPPERQTGQPVTPSSQEETPVQTIQKFYRIQLGAFSTVSAARQWRDKLESELKLSRVVVLESSGIFKVLYGAFATREEAMRELKRLHNANIYGFIVYE